MITTSQLTKKEHFTRGESLEREILRLLQNHCQQRFATSIRMTNRSKIRPIYVYCLQMTGVDKATAFRLLHFSKATWYRDVDAGEVLIKRTQQGKKLYDEIMTIIRQTIQK